MDKVKIEALKKQEAQTNAWKPFLLKGEFQEIWGKSNWRNLFGHIDISSLVFFRIFFGAIMFYEVLMYLQKGYVRRYYIAEEYFFNFWPFTFLEPLSGNGMYLFFYIMAGLAIFIMVGLFYRISISAFFLGFTYWFLCAQSRYLNHFYMISLISFVMIFLPLGKSVSLDALLFKKKHAETTPSWNLWIIRFMIMLPYFFGGIAKLNNDWFHGYPLKIWLEKDNSIPIIGPYLGEDWMATIFSYSGLFLDLLIVPALLFRKTRGIAFLAIFFFHLLNSKLWNIDIFPWLMIGATALFFSPDWPRRLYQAIKGKSWSKWPLIIREKADILAPGAFSRNQRAMGIGLVIWCTFHCLYPLRHHLIPGDVAWTEEGHRFAWRMKLTDKSLRDTYIVVDKVTGEEEKIKGRDILPRWKAYRAGVRPHMVWQFCQIIKEDYKKQGKDVSVYADIRVSLNGRKFQQLIDPKVDLTVVPRPLIPPSSWIKPLKTPLTDSRLNDD